MVDQRNIMSTTSDCFRIGIKEKANASLANMLEPSACVIMAPDKTWSGARLTNWREIHQTVRTQIASR